ncbi:MAG: hypothetical protein M3O28_04590, partial [Actinomycetota bacterium]|nr:hypothetical protein [Actinomycetota bacterium]
ADLAAAHDRLTEADHRVAQLLQDPAVLTQPASTIDTARSVWQDTRDTRRAEEHRAYNVGTQTAYNARITSEAIARMKYASDHIDPNRRSGPGPGVRR